MPSGFLISGYWIWKNDIKKVYMYMQSVYNCVIFLTKDVFMCHENNLVNVLLALLTEFILLQVYEILGTAAVGFMSSWLS